MPGTTKLSRLEENLGSTNLTLTPDEVQHLEQASATIPIVGERYPATPAKLIDR